MSLRHPCLGIFPPLHLGDFLSGSHRVQKYTAKRLRCFRHTSAYAAESVGVGSDYSAAHLRLNHTSDASKSLFHLLRTSPRFPNLLFLGHTQLYVSKQHYVTDRKLDGGDSLILFSFCSHSGLYAFAIQLLIKQHKSVCTTFWLTIRTNFVNFISCLERLCSGSCFHPVIQVAAHTPVLCLQRAKAKFSSQSLSPAALK